MSDVLLRIRGIIAGMSVRRRVAVVLAVALLALVVLGIAAVNKRFFPALIVNGEAISARRVDRDLQAAVHGYDRWRSTYGLAATSTAIGWEEMERRVLDQLIDAVLVRQGARREAGRELGELVSAKVEKYEDRARLSAAARELYGLPLDTFVEEVLVPQAERDVLSGRLFLKGEKFEEWLANARRGAQVIVFSGRFRWENGQISLADVR